MALQKQRIKETCAHRCMRHGCKNPVSWRVASTQWWKLHDANANDGMTGVVFECCEEHVGVGWKVRDGH
jgi:hypothetical protein